MKKIFLPVVLIVLAASFAVAATWHERFVSNYKEKGIDLAVEIAVVEGASPDQIIKKAFTVEGLEREILIKALFCSGAHPEQVKDAAVNNNISEKTIDGGFQLALTECRRQMEENFNYIVPGSKSIGPDLSPWKFK